MKRIALLIGAPGLVNRPGFLPGVKADMANYRRFLLSATGGAWRENEFAPIPPNPKLDSLARYVSKVRADFALLVFSGHGSVDAATGQQLVQVNPFETVELRRLLPTVPKLLLVVDACRVVQDVGLAGFLGEEAQYFPNGLPLAVARQQFQRRVAASPVGFTTLFGCQPGTTAQDTPGGGRFSLTLLSAANQWVQAPGPATCLTAPEAFRYAEDVMLAQPPQQLPQMQRNRQLAEHQMQFPFAFRQPQQVF